MLGAGRPSNTALDEVERIISAIAQPGPDRQRVRARLNVCLSTLEDEPTEEDIESASDDEMFQILDTELEAS